MGAKVSEFKGDGLRPSKTSFFGSAPPPDNYDDSDTSSLSSLSGFEDVVEPKDLGKGKKNSKKAPAADKDSAKTPTRVSGRKRSGQGKVQSQVSDAETVNQNNANGVRVAERQTVEKGRAADPRPAATMPPPSLLEIPGISENNVTPPSSHERDKSPPPIFKSPLKAPTHVEARESYVSPRAINASIPAVQNLTRSTADGSISQEQQLEAESQARQQLTGLKKGGKQTHIVYDSSQLSSLTFALRKYPDTPRIIQIVGRDFMDPKTGHASWSLLKSLIEKDWPVNLSTQRLLVNWRFRLMRQDDLDTCLNELCKYGKPLHSIVLFDMDRGKFIPKPAQRIMQVFAEKDFWKGKESPNEWEGDIDGEASTNGKVAGGDVCMLDAGTEPSASLHNSQTAAAAPSANDAGNVDGQRSSDISEPLSFPARMAAATVGDSDGRSTKRRAIEVDLALLNSVRPNDPSQWRSSNEKSNPAFPERLLAFISSPSRQLRNLISRNGESSSSATSEVEAGNHPKDVSAVEATPNTQAQRPAQFSVPVASEVQNPPPAVTTEVASGAQEVDSAVPSTIEKSTKTPAKETPASANKPASPQGPSAHTTPKPQPAPRGRGRPRKFPIPKEHNPGPSKGFSIHPQGKLVLSCFHFITKSLNHCSPEFGSYAGVSIACPGRPTCIQGYSAHRNPKGYG
jgi:hypothetical protein